MKTRILLTGATTMLGAEMLRELLRREEVETITLIAAYEEMASLESYLGPLPASVIPLVGDFRLKQFGLSASEWKALTNSIGIGFHCAQRETRDQKLELARTCNVRPIETWIEMLARNPKLRLNHLSTAFVGGTRRGLFTEFDLNCGQGFNDAWERSKFEAELLIRESSVSNRVTIFRPSHLLGRAKTGEAFELGGAYPLLATLAGASILPGDPRARLDFVPADYVAAAMIALGMSGSSGTFQLACGWRKSITVKRALERVVRGCGRGNGARLLPRAVAAPLKVAGSKALGHLASRSQAFALAHDQLHQSPVFDTYLAELALEPFGIAFPAPDEWLETIVSTAEQRRWPAPTVHSESVSLAADERG